MNRWKPFEEARDIINKIGLKSQSEWKLYKQNKLLKYGVCPLDIPSKPEHVYRNDGWIGYKDWLGQEGTEIYLPFEEAREFVRKLEIHTSKDWKKYRIGELSGYPLKPDNIPSQPEQTYSRKGWKNYKDWLNNPPLNYEEAQKFAQKLGITTSDEWNSYCKGEMSLLASKPKNIPRNPDCQFYKKGWVNWEHWLTGKTDRKYGEWLSYTDARKFIHSLGLKSYLDWKLYSKGELAGYKKRPSNIPSGPDYVYKGKGWIDYCDWLGYK